MEFSYRNSSSSVGSDRLKKAIERNRAKQAKRSTTSRATSSASASSPRMSVARSANESTFATPIKRRAASKSLVVKAPVKRVRSTTAKKTKRTRKKRDLGFTLPMWATKLGWILCAVILVRLVFADRGVIDYYSRDKIYQSYLQDHKDLIQENSDIELEIKKIKTNRQYQRKLVRDHLGFISKDEFLILFAKDS